MRFVNVMSAPATVMNRRKDQKGMIKFAELIARLVLFCFLGNGAAVLIVFAAEFPIDNGCPRAVQNGSVPCVTHERCARAKT